MSEPICKRRHWNEIVVWFLTNVVTHAFTTITQPGSPVFKSLEAAMISLILPCAGVVRAMRVLRHVPFLGKSHLEVAARSGALCVVTRTRPPLYAHGDPMAYGGDVENTAGTGNRAAKDLPEPVVEGADGIMHTTSAPDPPAAPATHPVGSSRPSLLKDSAYKYSIHGQVYLPDGYDLVRLPGFVEIEDISPQPDGADPSTRKTPSSGTTLASNNNLIRASSALLQLAFGTLSLIKATKGVFERYGYAAYAITLIPYTVMSLVNFVTLFMGPNYPCMFILESEVLAEARTHGAVVTGTVGKVSDGISEGRTKGGSGLSEIFAGHMNNPEYDQEWDKLFLGPMKRRKPTLIERISFNLTIPLTIVILLAPTLVVYLFTHWKYPDNTPQYIYARAWFFASSFTGFAVGLWDRGVIENSVNAVSHIKKGKRQRFRRTLVKQKEVQREGNAVFRYFMLVKNDIALFLTLAAGIFVAVIWLKMAVEEMNHFGLCELGH